MGECPGGIIIDPYLKIGAREIVPVLDFPGSAAGDAVMLDIDQTYLPVLRTIPTFPAACQSDPVG